MKFDMKAALADKELDKLWKSRKKVEQTDSRSSQIKLTLLLEGSERIYTGYKIVGWDNFKKRAFSTYDPTMTYKIKKGSIHSNSRGLYLGTTRDFAVDYYGGGTDFDYDMLLICQYKESDIIKGDPTAKSGEVKVKQYKVIESELVESLH